MIILQIDPAQEAQFLFYLIPVTMGLQLAFYYIYQYFKIQEVNLKLNRILLSFGAFTLLLVLGALFINISRTLITDPTITDIIYRFGWAFALSSPIGFLYFIILEDFSSLMNLTLVKILSAVGLVPIILVFIVPSTRSPIFLGSLACTFLSTYYILSFQIKLIRRSMGTIKKKFKQFFTGELISLTALVFAILVGLGVLPPGINEIAFYLGVAILITGFIIVFISAYDFPPFYEFEWKENLLKFFVINQKNTSCLFFCNLTDVYRQLNTPTETKADDSQSTGDILFSKGITGIETIISTITNTKNEKINRIDQEDSLILLEYETMLPHITYILVVKKDLKSFQHVLKSLKGSFNTLFQEVLLNLDDIGENPEQIFGIFNNYLKEFLLK